MADRIEPSGGGQDRDLFLALSVALTGFDHVQLIGTGVADLYFETTKAQAGPEVFAALMRVGAMLGPQDDARRRDTVAEEIYGAETLKAAAERLLMLWYTGTWYVTLPFVGSPASGEAYVEGLMWRAIGSHPMAAKPQGYGSWSRPLPADPLGPETATEPHHAG